MSILSGFLKEKRYKKTTNGYKLVSQDTQSDTVFMPDGNTAATNLGSIQGISSSSTATSDNIAASIGYVNEGFNEVNSNLPFALGIDDNGNYGYIKAGADTVTPFRSLINLGNVSGYCVPKTFDISKIASNYKNLSANNFLLDASPMSNVERGGSESAYRSANFYAPKKSYNASTGALTVISGGFFYDSADSSYDYKVGVGTVTVYLTY